MYPKKFREKVIWALDNGRSIRKVASDFGISTNTVVRWQKSIEPTSDDKRGRAGKIDIQALLKDVETYPDAYHHERAERFNCSRSAITRCLKRLNISKKNSPTS